MAKRPWVIPAEVKAYSDLDNVRNRPDEKLAFDIARAEQTAISRTNNRFEDETAYPSIPEPVRYAVILIAEYYADKAVRGSKEYKSETFDDYSYTVSDSSTGISWAEIAPLLEEYTVKQSKNAIVMKMRKL